VSQSSYEFEEFKLSDTPDRDLDKLSRRERRILRQSGAKGNAKSLNLEGYF